MRCRSIGIGGIRPVSKSNLTHLRPTFHLLTRVAQVPGYHRRVNSVYRTRLSQANGCCESFNSKAARCVLEWRKLLFYEGILCSGQTLARPRQDFQTRLVAGPPRASAGRVADRRSTAVGRSGKQTSPSDAPLRPGSCDESIPLLATRRQQSIWCKTSRGPTFKEVTKCNTI